jgi:hypothetical protein
VIHLRYGDATPPSWAVVQPASDDPSARVGDGVLCTDAMTVAIDQGRVKATLADGTVVVDDAQPFTAGTLVRTAGLKPTKEGVRVRSNYGKLSVTEGPFTETKEVIGGFAVLEAASMKEAIELTKRFLEVHGDEWNVECEVRPFDGEEFSA